MESFWLGSVILSLLAVFFIAFPFLNSRVITEPEQASDSDKQDAKNVTIFQERFAELEAERASGSLTEERFKALKAELELELIAAVEHSQQAELRRKSWSTPLVLSFVAIALVISYSLYFKWGAYDLQEQRLAMQFAPEELERAQAAAESGDMKGLMDQLYEKLKETPENVEGWMLYARTAMNMENYKAAIEGFSNVASTLERLEQNAGAIYGMLAQAYYFDAGQHQNDEVKASLEKAFKAQPNETNALGLQAIIAFDKQDYLGAIASWEQLLDVAPDHPSASSVRAGIARARSLGNIAQQTTEEGGIQLTSGPSLSISISLGESIKENINPEHSLFVFARSTEGPPLPLAAVKLKASDLPAQVILDDSKAMSPMAKLSSAKTVMVTARVSASGNPIAAPGDHQGQTDVVTVLDGETKLDLIIDQAL